MIGHIGFLLLFIPSTRPGAKRQIGSLNLPNVQVSDGWPHPGFRIGNAVLGRPFAPQQYAL
jgi:hypothetical protein